MRTKRITLIISLLIIALLIHEKITQGYWFKLEDVYNLRPTHEKLILALIVLLIIVVSMKYLLAIMHPRRLDFFLNSLEKIDYVDILLVKNYPIIEAQNRIKKYFLEHNYDYLILTSDDVEIPYTAPAKIMLDVELYGYDIITGYSKIRPQLRYVNINLDPIRNIERFLDRPIWFHQYNFLTINEVLELLLKGEYMIPVWFVGWSLTAMSRRVVEAWTPRGWYFQRTKPYHETYKGRRGFWASSDLWFSYQTWKQGFEKYADLSIYVPHYPPRPQPLLVGKEPPEVEFRPRKKALTLIRTGI